MTRITGDFHFSIIYFSSSEVFFSLWGFGLARQASSSVHSFAFFFEGVWSRSASDSSFFFVGVWSRSASELERAFARKRAREKWPIIYSFKMTHNLFLSILLHCGGLVSLASERASTVFSELVSYFCLRFRVEPVPSAHRGRVQWWQKLYCQFFFSAGNVFFERNRKIPLCFFIFPEGPRVTEVTKLKILSQLEDWE